ncbi:MAG: DNA-directed RNA polymerase subunit K [Candidatus Woesearchaeota archaeon]
MAKSNKTEEDPKSFTKYEKARILGSRALQISMGAPYLVKISKKQLEDMQYNPLEIAKLEFEAGVVPIGVVRPLPVVETREKPAE